MKRARNLRALSGITKMIEVPKPEQPMLSFNRLCFGLMNNDYILAFSAGVKFVASMIFLVYVSQKSI